MGSDEVGFGNWAGPMIVVAVAGPPGWEDLAVTDSKALTDAKRRALKAKYENDSRFRIKATIVQPSDIDELGASRALLQAHGESIRGVLSDIPQLIVVDGTLQTNRMGLEGKDVMTLPKADLLVPEVGLASCIAKTLQVDAMQALDAQFPEYGFARHHGYGTKQHQQALETHGPCSAHRKSYAPVRKALYELLTKDSQRLEGGP